MFLLSCCPFKIQKVKRACLQFTRTDYLSKVLTPVRIRWTMCCFLDDLQNERQVRKETERDLFSHNLTSERPVKFTRSKSPKIVNTLSFRILLRGNFVSQFKIKVVLLSVKNYKLIEILSQAQTGLHMTSWTLQSRAIAALK